MTKVLRGRIKSGRMVWDSPEEALEHVRVLEGKRVEVIIREAHRRPSRATHGYYRAGILPAFAEAVGCTPGEMHRALKRELLPLHVESANPRKVRSTADLSQREFNEFISQVTVLASEIGIVLPSPGEMDP